MSIKFKTKKKDIMENYQLVISTGYNQLTNLLQYKRPTAYTMRKGSWECDVYEIDSDTVLISGWNTFGNISSDSRLLQQYDKEAEKYVSEHKLTNASEVQEHLDKLLKELVEKILQNTRRKYND